ncbi:serine/threonine-protein kinase [Nocardioides sp.]|uniref:serine/threonine-protein kinase n=1 Tax=Nocardioides sp. TaxID=35761 RepID=UPI0031FF150A|nr:pknB 3 [Nocardioides sp.]
MEITGPGADQSDRGPAATELMDHGDQPPPLAGRYDLQEVIGRGGMADVYRAADRVLSRAVAIKVLRESAENDTDRARFTSEARTLAGLSHSGLVMVLDAGISAERPFLVMELVVGPTLSEALAAGPMDSEQVGAIGTQIADALAYAHAQGVVHRDVKPGNVLLDVAGRVKLADFGIARLIGDTVRHTRTGHAIGTAAYLAPEQVTGGDVRGAADVYSLGLVLLEALTGERAYPGPPTEAALARLSRAPDVPESLPGAWRSLLTAMTALAPSDRPTAGEAATQMRAQPTSPIPLATSAPPEAETARLPSVGQQPSAPEPRTSIIDRAGDGLARQPRAIATWFRKLRPHERGVIGAVGAVILLIVVAGLVAGGSPGTDDKLPDQTPPRLEQPLRDLHDAVYGR